LSEIEIGISDNQDTLEIDQAKLRRTVEYVLGRIRGNESTDGNESSAGSAPASVSLAIVDDGKISKLKEQYFGVAEVTDVISFDLRDNTKGEPEFPDCEIVVNAQCAVREASRRDGDPQAELNLYVAHGLLHQLGYDDRTEQQAEIMHKKEDQLLEELGFGTVYGGTG
jgi:probable rRNA maturation factor